MLRKLIFSLTTLLIVCGSGFSDDLASRMSARRTAIEALKQKGIVGENNQGYLGFVTSTKEQADLVDAQNEDRKKGYQIVAQKQGVESAKISQVRAAYYARKTKPGQWYQNKSSRWVKK